MTTPALARFSLASLCTGGALALAMCGGGSGGPSTQFPEDMTVFQPPDTGVPGPTLTALSQTTSATAGGGSVVITGTGFKSGAIVKFGPLDAAVQSVSDTSITVRVPSSGGQLGKFDVTVRNPDGGTVTAARAFAYRLGTVTFAVTPLTDTSARAPRAVYARDLDGKNGPDLLTVNAASNTYSVYLNDGKGVFTLKGTPVALVNCTNPFSATLADVTGEGTPDLLVPCRASSGVAALKGNGDGTFTAIGTLPVPSNSGPQSVAVLDVDGDKKVDLLVALGASNESNLHRLLGDGSGGFTAPATQYPSLIGSIYALTTADLDQSGPKVVITYEQSAIMQNFNYALLTVGAGGFRSSRYMTGGDSPHAAAVADFDGSGTPDLVFANTLGNGTKGSISIVTQSAGGFALKDSSPATTVQRPEGIAAGDVDGDGDPDVVTANSGLATETAGDLTLFLGDGKGGFAAGKSVSTGSAAATGKPTSVVIGDWNGDGRPDLAATNFLTTGGQLVVLLNTGT